MEKTEKRGRDGSENLIHFSNEARRANFRKGRAIQDLGHAIIRQIRSDPEPYSLAARLILHWKKGGDVGLGALRLGRFLSAVSGLSRGDVGLIIRRAGIKSSEGHERKIRTLTSEQRRKIARQLYELEFERR